MPAASPPPDENLLRQFLLGELAGPDLQQLADYLERHPEVASTLNALKVGDTLLDALRGRAADAPDPPELTALMAHLAGLAEHHGAQDPVGEQTLPSPGTPPALDATAAAPTEPGSRPDDISGVLAPGQRDDEIGRLGRYRVLRVLGRGGMGAVFAAEDDKLKRKVALKVMLPNLAASPAARQRFVREAETAAKVEHDHIVPIYDIAEDRGIPFLAMPLLVGETLDDQLGKVAGPLAPADVLVIGRHIAEGLAAAHAAGLIHRDIKPSNVWLERTAGGAFKRARILDFGLARLARDGGEHITQSGAILGTPAYMAPEQARGAAVDHRADLFSLGCVLYKMATGHRPFQGSDTFAILTALAVDHPPAPVEVNPNCPPELSALIVRLLTKNPAERWPPTAQDVADELARLAGSPGSQPGSVTSVSLSAPPPALVAPRPEVVASGGAPKATAADGATRTAAYDDPDDEFAPPARRRSRAPLWVAVALLFGGLAFAAYQYGGQVIRIATNEGELVIEVDDPNVEVTVKQNGAVVGDKTKKRDYVLTAGSGEVTFHDPDGGASATTKAFEIRRGEKVVLRATMADVAAARPKPPVKKIEPVAKKPDPIDTASPRADRKPIYLNGGEWRVDGAELVQAKPGIAVLLFGDRTWTDYDVSVETKTVGGPKDRQGANLYFRVKGPTDYLTFSLGAYGGTFNELHRIEKGQWGRDIGPRRTTFEPDSWYTMLVRVRGSQVRCSLDGQELFDHNVDRFAAGGIGFGTWNSAVRWKNLKVTAPDGRVLFDGFPDLPAAGPGSQPNQLTAAQRKALERTLAVGGRLTLDIGSEVVLLEKGGRLPDGPFVPRIAFYENVRELDDTSIEELKELPPLAFGLVLRNTSVTGAGLAKVATYPLAPGLLSLDLSGTTVTDEDLKHLAAFPKLEFLHLFDCKITGPGLRHAAALPRLTQLDLSGCRDLAPDALKHLAGSKLQILTLPSAARLGDDAMRDAAALPALTQLQAATLPITDEGLTHLAGCASLTKLTITNTKVTKVGVEKLAAALPKCRITYDGGEIAPRGAAPMPDSPEARKALAWVLANGGSLSVRSAANTIANIEAGGKLPDSVHSVIGLNLSGVGAKLTDASVENLRDLPVVELQIGLSGTALTDAGVAKLFSYPWVSQVRISLALGETRITDAALEAVANCREVSQLNLNATAVTGTGLRHLAGMRKLTHLALDKTAVNGDALTALKGCTMQFLSLAGCGKIDDDALASLSVIPGLANLSLRGTTVGDAGLDHVAGLKGLRFLNVQQTRVTAAGVKKLAAALPNCQILYDGGAIAPRNTAPSPDSPEARKALAWVLDNGGKLTLIVGGKTVPVAARGKLPTGEFTVRTVELGRIGDRLTDTSVENLRHLPAVSESILMGETPGFGTALTDAGYAKLLAYPGVSGTVTSLNILHAKVTDAVLEHVARMTSLRTLNLSKTAVTGAGFHHLAGLPNLEYLGIVDSLVTADGLKSLAGCGVRRLSLRVCPRIGDDALDHLPGLPNLEELTFSDTAVTDAGLGKLARVRLDRLGINGRFTDAGLQALGKCEVTDGLTLTSQQITDAGLVHLKGMATLRTLDVQGTKVTAEGAAKLAELLPGCSIVYTDGRIYPKMPATKRLVMWAVALGGTAVIHDGQEREVKDAAGLPDKGWELRELRFVGNQKFSDACLKEVARHYSLQALNIQGTRITDHGLKHVQQITGLQSLNCDSARGITDDGLTHLAELPRLEYLNLRSTGVTGPGLKHLAGLGQLKTLDLGGTPVTADHLKGLIGAKGLRTLILNGTRVADGGLKDLADLPALRELALGDTPLTDAGLKELAGCAALESLAINGTKVTAVGLAALADLKSLRSLDIHGTTVTEEGLKELARMKGLRSLNLSDARVTKAQAAALGKALPDCRIEHEGGVIEPGKK